MLRVTKTVYKHAPAKPGRVCVAWTKDRVGWGGVENKTKKVRYHQTHACEREVWYRTESAGQGNEPAGTVGRSAFAIYTNTASVSSVGVGGLLVYFLHVCAQCFFIWRYHW